MRPENARPATPADALNGVQPAWVIEPGSEEELAQALKAAERDQLAVVPRGGGTKLGWGEPPERADAILSARRLDRVLEHAAGDMTATVEAGCTVAALQDVLARGGQRLALDPLWPGRATVGGVLATNDSGSLRAGFGSLRDLVLGVTVALPDGTLARSGGKVVKNVAGYDLPKLMTGALGTLGVITRATFRLHPLPAATRTFGFTAQSPGEATRFVLAMQDSTLPVTGLQVVVEHEAFCRVDVRVEGSPSGVDASASSTMRIAAACGLAPSEETTDPWTQRERLWDTPGVVAKVTFLPSRLADLCAAIASGEGPWGLVCQGVGVGFLTKAMDVDEWIALAGRATTLGGSLVVLRGKPELKRRVNAAEALAALPLMRAIKQKFDPTGTLNPGRFGGGI